ncbi:Uncharacterised protein [Halioglobus japonicus]|nr:Uncharacterised protein [Halioglobus japonicus]
MKRSGKEALLLVLVTVLWLAMVFLYWPVALIFLVPIAIHFSGRKSEEKYAAKFDKDEKDKIEKDM